MPDFSDSNSAANMVTHKCLTQWIPVTDVTVPLPHSFDLGYRGDNMTVLSQLVDSWMLDNPNKTLTQLGALSYLARQFGEKYGHRHGQHNLIRQIRHDDAPDDWGAPPFVRQGVFDAINRL